LTDRLVIATLAADSIPHALQSIVSAHPEEQRENARNILAEGLQGVINQQLVTRVGGGLVLVPELLIPDTAARSVIREGSFNQLINITQTSREHGMVSRDSVLAQYAQQGIISVEDAKSYAHDPEQLDVAIRRY